MGVFVMSPKIFKFIKNDKSYLERQPLENLSKKNKLGAYKHFGILAVHGYFKRQRNFRKK